MPLISCPECEHKVSDAANACPSCGFPLKSEPVSNAVKDEEPESLPEVAVEATSEKRKELFKAGKVNYVLDEITSVSSTESRNWVYMVVALPLIIAVIYGWMNYDWMLATGITVAALFILGMLITNEGSIATTGDVKEMDGDSKPITAEYKQRMEGRDLITYEEKSLLLDMRFAINPARVAEFNEKKWLKEYVYYGLAIAAAYGSYAYNVQPGYILAALFAFVGYLNRKSLLEITSVGGAKVTLYTRCRDIKRIMEDLTKAVEAL